MKEEGNMNILIAIILLVLGFVMLTKGADWFVDGSSALAARLGIPQLVIGLTIVAMGTSAPEAAVSITSALKGNEGITVGNVVGSNIMNILLILGIASVIVPLAVQKSTRMIEIPYMIAITILFGVLGYTGEMITRIEGGILWIAFLIYLGYLLWMAKKGKEENEPDEKQKSLPVQLLTILVGLVCIVLGSDFVVDGATEIAKVIGISERIIGLTIVAFGTSLPELVTSVTAARRGNADIAIGNIVGSNVFNILFVAGTSALISPVVFESKFVLDTAVATATAVLLLVCVCNKEGKLKRSGGIIMLAAYAVYFVKLLIG
jgi:cation:H+ antiporter